MADFTWTKAEKLIARNVFDQALNNELAELMKQFKKKAEKVKEPKDLWAIKDYLVQKQKELNQKYDFRYSMLGIVFGVLLREKHINEQQLKGLSEDKIKTIKGISSIK